MLRRLFESRRQRQTVQLIGSHAEWQYVKHSACSPVVSVPVLSKTKWLARARVSTA
jgi:hypothetical protein